jgi:DNA-directed RNA polymerase subunit RPC12/RpoP
VAGPVSLECPTCGGGITAPARGNLIECPYCGRTIVFDDGGRRARVETERPRTIADDLLEGYTGRDIGAGERYGLPNMRERGWHDPEHAVWPVAGRASSTFGPGWWAEEIAGPPKVYPRYGTEPGSWAPKARTSHTEWLEARFAEDLPAMRAIRVFEVAIPGATFAVTFKETPDGEEHLVWQRPPERINQDPWVLEVPLDPPQHVAVVRAYLSNEWEAWTRIDTIGLISDSPLPPSMRTAPRRSPRRRGLLLAGVAGVGVALAVWFALADPDETGRRSIGATVTSAGPEALDGAVWATGATASSEWEADKWSARQATGVPDTYPEHRDSIAAWATKEADAGAEWLEVSFEPPASARAVLVVESFNPGTVVQIEDLSAGRDPAIVWEGVTEPVAKSRILRFELPEPRRIDRLRITLDTARVGDWNELDAVGLIPE